MLKMISVAVLLICGSEALSTAQAPASAPLARHYQDGQKLAYRMDGQNEDWKYTIHAHGLVKQDGGRFFEEVAWVGMMSGGTAVALREDTKDFRQRLSLDPNQIPGPPDLTKLDPRMIGPVTDLMTFYADLWLANKLGTLHNAGDHFHFANPMPPSSWADGTRVLTGESAIDFDMTLKSIDAENGQAVLEVKHVPPAQPKVQLKADWMKTPVGDKSNNWVGITKQQDGTFLAAVGQETFTDDITVSTADGRVVSATMDNPVKTIERVCKDEALTQCGDSKPHLIQRRISIVEEK
jgi:hypothetical protein